MRSCEAVRAELKAYCDGELGFLTRACVRHHLARCALCQAEAQALRRIGEELRNLDRQIVPSPELRARILQSLPDEPPVPARALNRPGLLTGLTLAGTTAVAALLVVIFYRMHPPSVTTQTADGATVTSQAPALAEKSAAERPPERARMVKVLPEEQQAILHPKAAPTEERAEAATGAPPVKSQVNLSRRPLPSTLPAEDSGAERFRSMVNDQTAADKHPRQSEPDVSPVPGAVPAISAAKPEDKARQPGERGGLSALSAKKDHLALAYQHPGEETIQLVVDDLEARLVEVEAVAKAEDAFVGRARKSADTGGMSAASVVVLVPVERAPELKKKLLALGMEEAAAMKFAPVAPQESPIALQRAQAAEKASKAQRRDADSTVRSEPEARQGAAAPTREYVPDPERLRTGAHKTRQSPPLVRFVVRLQQSPRPALAPAGTKK